MKCRHLEVALLWVLALGLFPALISCTSTGRFVTFLTKTSTVLAPAATQLGMSSRALTIDSINQMKRGEKEAAMESLQQAITTLAVLDVAGGGVVQNPFTSLLVNYISHKREFSNVKQALQSYNDAIRVGTYPRVQNQQQLLDEVADLKVKAIAEFKTSVAKLPQGDETLKFLNRAKTWSKVSTALDVFGAVFDAVAIGVNAWGFDIARRDGNVPGMVSAGLGIAAGIVGVTSFVIAIATGSAIAGPLGALVGAVLSLAATLVDIFSSNPSSNIDNTVKALQSLTTACKEELKGTGAYVSPLGEIYGTLYESNPANMIDVLGMPADRLTFKPGHGIQGEPGLLGAGKLRRLDRSKFSNAYWTASGSTTIGYDFYGKVLHDNRHGVTIFVDTKLVKESGTPLKGVNIQTYSAGYENYYLHDHVSIEDFSNLKDGQKMNIKTGYGNDIIAINGPLGKFTSAFTNVLDVETGTADNELTFGGISKSHSQIKGVYFNRITNRVGFYHGNNRQLHEFGTARGIVLVRGSPFNDHIIMHGDNFRAEQSHGTNTYEIDVTQATPGEDPITHTIVDASGKVARIRVTHSGNVKEENFNYVNKVLTISLRVSTNDPWSPIRYIKLGCNEEPMVELYKNGRHTKNLIVGWMRKYQFDGEEYNYIFYQDRTGTSRNDVINIKAPGSGPKSSHTIDGGEGSDNMVLTNNLMEVYDIKPGQRTLHLVYDSDDWVLKIRHPGQNYIRHDVIIKNVEYVLNDKLETLLDIGAAQSNDIDLGKLYRDAEALNRS